MSKRFLKIFQQLDIKEVQAHLLIYGDLAGQCAHCQAIDLKLDQTECPQCKATFKYVSFRNIKQHLPKMLKLHENCPGIIFVDHDDYKKNLAAVKAEDFLK